MGLLESKVVERSRNKPLKAEVQTMQASDREDICRLGQAALVTLGG